MEARLAERLAGGIELRQKNRRRRNKQQKNSGYDFALSTQWLPPLLAQTPHPP